MNAVPIWIPLVSVIVGAFASGGIQALLREVDRQREQNSILNAITSEVAVICELVRFRRYESYLTGAISAMETEPSKIIHPIADISAEYFSVFHSLSSSLGKVKAHQARAIVRFYTTGKAIVDSLNPNGAAHQIQDPAVILEHHRQLHEMLRKSLELGDEIVQFTAASLPSGSS